MPTFRDFIENKIGLLDIPIDEFSKTWATNHIKGGIKKTPIKTIGGLLSYDVKKIEDVRYVGAPQSEILKEQLLLFYCDRVCQYCKDQK
jgi:hypothetical protein